jgi:hypothetical protein
LKRKNHNRKFSFIDKFCGSSTENRSTRIASARLFLEITIQNEKHKMYRFLQRLVDTSDCRPPPKALDASVTTTTTNDQLPVYPSSSVIVHPGSPPPSPHGPWSELKCGQIGPIRRGALLGVDGSAAKGPQRVMLHCVPYEALSDGSLSRLRDEPAVRNETVLRVLGVAPIILSEDSAAIITESWDYSLREILTSDAAIRARLATIRASERCTRRDTEWMAENPELTVEQRFEYMIQIANGLRHIHEHGHVHGKLGLHSVVRSDTDSLLKICHMRLGNDDDALLKLPESFQTDHAFIYRAPDAPSMEADVYAAGVLMWEVATSCVTLEQDRLITTASEWSQRQRHVNPVCPMNMIDGMGALLMPVLCAAMERDPTHRPTAEQLWFLIQCARNDWCIRSVVAPEYIEMEKNAEVVRCHAAALDECLFAWCLLGHCHASVPWLVFSKSLNARVQEVSNPFSIESWRPLFVAADDEDNMVTVQAFALAVTRYGRFYDAHRPDGAVARDLMDYMVNHTSTHHLEVKATAVNNNDKGIGDTNNGDALQGWFWGSVSREEAERALCGMPPRTWLVRSRAELDGTPFAVSFVVANGSGRVKHRLIRYDPFVNTAELNWELLRSKEAYHKSGQTLGELLGNMAELIDRVCPPLQPAVCTEAAAAAAETHPLKEWLMARQLITAHDGTLFNALRQMGLSDPVQLPMLQESDYNTLQHTWRVGSVLLRVLRAEVAKLSGEN